MKKENAFLQKLDKIGNLTQVVCLSLFLTGVSVQGVSAETGFPISQSVQQTKTVTGQVVDETGEPVIGASGWRGGNCRFFLQKRKIYRAGLRLERPFHI